MPQELSVVRSEPLEVVSSVPLAATTEPSPGYWEDLPGLRGKAWHPAGVAPGLDPASRRTDTPIASTGLMNINAEDVLIGGQVVRGIRSAVATATGAPARAAAGLRATLTAATPIVKYEVTKSLLESMGLPSSLSIVVAMGVSGVRHGANEPPRAPGTRAGRGPAPPPVPTEPVVGTKPRVPASQAPADELRARILGPAPTGGYVDAPAVPSGPTAPPVTLPLPPASAPVPGPASAPAPRAAPAAPVASPPVAPAPPAVRVTPPVAPTGPAAQWSPQRLANEVGLAARRAKLQLTDAQYAEAEALVLKGQSPASAVRAVAPPPKLKLTAAEMRAYTAARKDGVPHDEAMQLIQATRELATRLGTPSSEAVRQAVTERNTSGRWPE